MKSFSGIQQCARCDGSIPREHFIVLDKGDHVETMLYCEHCNEGVEATFDRVDGDLSLSFSLNYRQRTEPKCFNRFLARLGEAVGMPVSA